MADSQQVGYWFLVTVLLVGISLATLPRASTRRFLGPPLSRLGTWALDVFRPVEELDPVADELFRVVRRERLRADISRLQRIIATDMFMSATRQLGNRIAYDWLLRELASLRGLPETMPADGPLADWNVRPMPSRAAELVGRPDPRRGPKVEILDIGWKR